MNNLRTRLGLDREMTSENIIKTDVYRYKRNTLASGLALLGLFINCLYFMLFYGVNYPTYANVLIGLSVLVNLFVLLATFLASEGVKGYNKKYSILLLVVAVIQIVRIFIYPLDLAGGGSGLFENTAGADISIRYFGANLSHGALAAILIIYLVLSAACVFASAVTGYIRGVQLEKFTAGINAGTISVDEALKDLDQKDEQSAKEGEATNA